MFVLVLADGFWALNDSFHSLMGTINLVAQIALLVLFYVSIRFRRKGNLVWHGNTMLAAVAANAVSVFLAMLPSIPQFYAEHTPSFYVSIVHGILGAVAEVLGVYLVAGWALADSSLRFCAGKGKMMRITMALWTISLVIGIAIYVLHVGFDL